MLYILSGSIIDHNYASRASCFITFFKFIERAQIFGVNVQRGYCAYELIEDSRADPYGADYYRGATLFLLEIDPEQMALFLKKLTNFVNFPYASGNALKVPHDDAELLEFMKEYDLSFDDLENSNFLYEGCINNLTKILLHDYLSPSETKSKESALDLGDFDGHEFFKDSLICFDSNEAAEKAFVVNLLGHFEFGESKTYDQLSLSHRFDEYHPSTMIIQDKFSYLIDKAGHGDGYSSGEFQEKVFQRSCEFLPNLNRQYFDQSSEFEIIADCLMEFLDKEIEGHPVPEGIDKKGFLMPNKPLTEEENRLREQVIDAESAAWDADFREIMGDTGMMSDSEKEIFDLDKNFVDKTAGIAPPPFLDEDDEDIPF